MDKKSQIWYTDFIVGIFIFFIVILVYYGYAHSFNQNPSSTASDLLMDAKTISQSLVAQGFPSGWNQSDVQIIGLTDGNYRLNSTKLGIFADMEYSLLKARLRTSYEFYFYLEEVNGSRILINGKEGVGLPGENSKNLVSIIRVVIFNSRLINMVVNVWQP